MVRVRHFDKWWRHDEAWERYDYSYSDEELTEWLPKIGQLDQATLRAPSIQKGSEAAPFAGAITALEVSPGGTVMPGQAVLTLAETHHLQAVTTDLSERDVTQVSVGQRATVYVEALDIEIEGQVVDIAPQADTVGGDVVYAVTIELDEQPPGLRWGMSVEVEIKVR